MSALLCVLIDLFNVLRQTDSSAKLPDYSHILDTANAGIMRCSLNILIWIIHSFSGGSVWCEPGRIYIHSLHRYNKTVIGWVYRTIAKLLSLSTTTIFLGFVSGDNTFAIFLIPTDAGPINHPCYYNLLSR
jgi:hypothetical protein